MLYVAAIFFAAPFSVAELKSQAIEAPFENAETAKIWIDVNWSAAGSVYSIRMNDMRNVSNKYPKVWIEGNHGKDRTLRYRRSMALYWFNCVEQTYSTLAWNTYAADGKTLTSWSGSSRAEPVVPGTLAEEWAEAACPPQ